MVFYMIVEFIPTHTQAKLKHKRMKKLPRPSDASSLGGETEHTTGTKKKGKRKKKLPMPSGDESSDDG